MAEAVQQVPGELGRGDRERGWRGGQLGTLSAGGGGGRLAPPRGFSPGEDRGAGFPSPCCSLPLGSLCLCSGSQFMLLPRLLGEGGGGCCCCTLRRFPPPLTTRRRRGGGCRLLRTLRKAAGAKVRLWNAQLSGSERRGREGSALERSVLRRSAPRRARDAGSSTRWGELPSCSRRALGSVSLSHAHAGQSWSPAEMTRLSRSLNPELESKCDVWGG